MSRVAFGSLCLVVGLAEATPSLAADMDVYGQQQQVVQDVPQPPPPPPPEIRGTNIDVDANASADQADQSMQGFMVPPQIPLASANSEEPVRRRIVEKPDPYGINGFDDGSFAIRPELDVNTVITDNANQSAHSRVTDVGIEINPQMSWATNWPVHSWTGQLSLDWIRFSTYTGSNRFTGAGATDFKVDFRRDLYADFAANVAMTETAPGSGDVPSDATGPRRDVLFGFSSGLTKDFGAWSGKATIGASRLVYGNVNYSDGSSTDNSGYNNWDPSITLRATLNNAAHIRPYAQIAGDWRFHDEAVVDGFHRNSEGASAAVGITLDDGPVWSGDLAGVLLVRHNDEESLGWVMVPGVAAGMVYMPRSDWKVMATSAVALNDNLAAGGVSPTWTLALSTAYLLRDNLSIRGGWSGSIGADGGGSGFDLINIVSFGADWQVSNHVQVSGTLQSTWQTTPYTDSTYDEQRASIGVVYKP